MRLGACKGEAHRREYLGYAGRRVLVSRDHMEQFTDPAPNALVFIGPKCGQLRRSNFRKFWHQAREAVGMPELHFHDLRHTDNTMAAAQGASWPGCPTGIATCCC